ncbi:FecCD family ABC transporter permease [Corynebacterium epidermidicanis]|uniref:ABC-type enterobactin transport system, permease component n=1 Tax=Corynebacterium epidermidicanis TaxID=1050174 RepID=A0A0G3GRK2_9CORY|nr:iron ABC transporter permease [Corynebacterium epidermidicanis]AKK03749.1 ABC-type enterobactin transport system, permease component [Corynebacterium epidermidicanis]
MTRYVWSSLLMLGLAAGGYLATLCVGAVFISPAHVVAVLNGGGPANVVNIIWELRLSVAIVTAVAGAALAIAGAWTQTIARNPLASPDLLGVSGGASLAVVAATALTDVTNAWFRSGYALAGAVAMLALLLLLGRKEPIDRLIIIGVALALFAQGAVSYLLLRADILRATEAQVWLAGSTAFARWEVVLPLLIGLLVFVLLGLSPHRDLRIVAHDDVTAIALGVRVQRTRLLLILAATGIVAVVVSIVGPITFVALVAPQLARLIGHTPTPPVLLSALTGAALLLWCATIAAALPVTAPVGLLTSALGGVMLVNLMMMQRTR